MKTLEKYLYGIIGNGLDIDTNILVSEIEQARKDGMTKCLFYVNSDGGEVIQGSSLFNYLDRTDMHVTWIVDGVAASMMAMLLTNPKHTVKAAKHAKFMYHRVQGYVYGNSSEVRSHADMIDTFEDSLIEMMATRMGVDASEVKNEFFTDGTDHWLSAQQALDRGLCDEIITGGRKLKEPDKLTNSRDVFNFYNKQIINFQNNKKMAKETNIYALALGLPDTEDESKTLAHIQNIIAQNKSLTDSLKAEKEKVTALENRISVFEKSKVNDLINQAVADKKISAEEKDTYVSLAEKDYVGVEKILNKMQGVTPVREQLNTKGTAAKYEGKSWDELDKSNMLASLKAEAPEVYTQLYNQKFNIKS